MHKLKSESSWAIIFTSYKLRDFSLLAHDLQCLKNGSLKVSASQNRPRECSSVNI